MWVRPSSGRTRDITSGRQPRSRCRGTTPSSLTALKIPRRCARTSAGLQRPSARFRTERQTPPWMARFPMTRDRTPGDGAPRTAAALPTRPRAVHGAAGREASPPLSRRRRDLVSPRTKRAGSKEEGKYFRCDTMTSWPSQSVDRLLGGTLGSVGSVELLLLLRRSSDRAFGVEELCVALQSPRTWAEQELCVLVRARVLVGEAQSGWRYAPATAQLARAVDDLAAAWQRDRRAVSRWAFDAERRHRRLRFWRTSDRGSACEARTGGALERPARRMRWSWPRYVVETSWPTGYRQDMLLSWRRSPENPEPRPPSQMPRRALTVPTPPRR